MSRVISIHMGPLYNETLYITMYNEPPYISVYWIGCLTFSILLTTMQSNFVLDLPFLLYIDTNNFYDFIFLSFLRFP